MMVYKEGPGSLLFSPLKLKGNCTLAGLGRKEKEMAATIKQAPHGKCICRGIPFVIDRVVLVNNKPVMVPLGPFKARWLVFMHTAQVKAVKKDKHGFMKAPRRGAGQLGEHAADYVFIYRDGSEQRVPIRRRFQIGAVQRGWGTNCMEAVTMHKPRPVEAGDQRYIWGPSQFRVAAADSAPWNNWLWAWENPHPDKPLQAVRFEPICGTVVISALTASNVITSPVKWESRQKALLTLPKGSAFNPHLSDWGLLQQVQLDLGQVISATAQPEYPHRTWSKTYNNKMPVISRRKVLVEYTAHPDACFHLPGKKRIAVRKVQQGTAGTIKPVAPATQRVTIRVMEKGNEKPVAVKLHLHGQAGEYLAPVDRHRIPNVKWFEDYSVDFSHRGIHHCTYIPGETVVDLPLGPVYLEVSKGFEIRPVRKMVKVTKATRRIDVKLDRVLPWRDQGWVTADTHVHFLSPSSALLEGAGEGVNVVNLLASQWGELMTNVGDFDGKTTLGSREAGGDGEYLVRVGTENRQHVLGHISLLGYNGNIIAPMTTGGPDESALGDPVECLLTQWARQCKKQQGVVILPHFPNPRAENAAAIVSEVIDGLEMTAWGDHYSGIDPYSLSDWYRYLNCGYFVAAVGGTDKMSANTAVGTVRTYAHINPDRHFTYEEWKKAIRRGHTFVTYGPLVEFKVDGKIPGGKLPLTASGGHVDITWEVASVIVPMTSVDLIVNGEVVRQKKVGPDKDQGSWSLNIQKSSWLALLIRGRYRDRPEMVAAHTSPVMVPVKGSPFMSAADAMTILEQIEGALAYIDTVGTRARTVAYKKMRLELTAAHRVLHNRMHQQGLFHGHTPVANHKEHRE